MIIWIGAYFQTVLDFKVNILLIADLLRSFKRKKNNSIRNIYKMNGNIQLL